MRVALFIAASFIASIVVLTKPSQGSSSCMSQSEARQHYGSVHLYWHGPDHCWDATPGRHRIVSRNRSNADRQAQRGSRHSDWREAMSEMLPGDAPAQVSDAGAAGGAAADKLAGSLDRYRAGRAAPPSRTSIRTRDGVAGARARIRRHAALCRHPGVLRLPADLRDHRNPARATTSSRSRRPATGGELGELPPQPRCLHPEREMIADPAQERSPFPAELAWAAHAMNILDPQGPIAAAEKTILLNSLAIMLAIVVPTIVAILAFAWWFRAIQHRAPLSARLGPIPAGSSWSSGRSRR